MKDLLETTGSQILEGLKIGERFKLPPWKDGINKILFCGMGGSAIGGDILRILTGAHARIPFEVSRTGRLPLWVDASTLVIFSSYSGNTPETVGCVSAAVKAGAKIIALSSGGQLLKTAAAKKIPFLQVPGGLPPRCAIGYLTFSLVPVLRKWDWLKFPAQDADEVFSTVRSVPHAKVKALAKRLFNKSVHFYGFSAFAEPVLTRWRAQLAENSKMLASSHLIPEMLHNEIESWKFPKDLMKKSAAVFFSDKEDLAGFEKKIKAAQKAVSQAGADVMEIRSEGKSLIARLFSLIVLADWVSYELALLNKVDPIRIPTIELLKKVG